ncbi:MAG TPA: type II secretion system protein N [Allosphingosinicella sp.]|nr:type II secretion system protein N [Allosphingosinicella sp.]
MAATAGRLAGLAVALAGAYAWLAASPAATVPQPRRPDPLPVPAAAAPAPEATPAPAPIPGSALGLILYGVSGGGSAGLAAIIGTTAGGQRLVRVGKDFRPGLRLVEVGRDHAVLVTGGQSARLELRRFGEAPAEAAPKRSDPDRDQGIEAAVLRHILKPVVSNGRIGGYALKGGESLPRLHKAGLRAGDVILSVNGSQLDEERMGELAWEMRNASRTEFIFIRDGRKMRASL